MECSTLINTMRKLNNLHIRFTLTTILILTFNWATASANSVHSQQIEALPPGS